ncbi:NUDIX domain-containing protein [Alkalibaculum bacchi]|uniref:NUDIX domain-containing protein n=1 Tax=Alkalibaculum bacchi TaxID=645887 RepID=A0A366I9N8_9FIRM|nr:CoA pyrophosphatase [Alkalibaculum bacchi]RBP66663.1 NUDIX domain-containing protein [Alkalibaculum bacchi]
MNIQEIVKVFENKKSKPFDIENYFSVLVPIIQVKGELHLLFQVRSNRIRRQPGEISFPGGKIERDETPKEACIRETYEEMGICEEQIEIIGQLDHLLNHTNDMIYPFVGILDKVCVENIDFSKDEVEEIFTVPLQYFMDHKPEVYDMSYKVAEDNSFPFHKIKNGPVYQNRIMTYPVYFYEYEKYIIWGLTAKITRNFIRELIKSNSLK